MTQTRLVAVIQFALILPAAVFLASVFVGIGDPPQYELARVARQIVGLFAGRVWTLWVFLLGLPLVALVAGAAALLQRRDAGAPSPAVLFVAWATGTAASIVAVVALHMAAN